MHHFCYAGWWRGLEVPSPKYELALANLSTTYLKRDFRALETSNAETIRLQNQKDSALRAAAQRVSKLANDRERIRTDLDGLRGDLAANAAAREALPGDSCATGADYTSTLEAVFGDCAAELGLRARLPAPKQLSQLR